jgi:hypothetical protein
MKLDFMPCHARLGRAAPAGGVRRASLSRTNSIMRSKPRPLAWNELTDLIAGFAEDGLRQTFNGSTYEEEVLLLPVRLPLRFNEPRRRASAGSVG